MKDKSGVDLTIVVPCLNEEENIEDILNLIRDLAIAQRFTSEIVIVDDKSDDRTQQLAQKWVDANTNLISARLVVRDLHRRGYGAVVRYGAAHGVGRYCIFVSADAVDPISLIPKLYEEMERGATLAQCSRYLANGDANTIPFKYKFFQFFFRIGVRIALGQHIPDSTYAFKMFKRREALGIGLSQNRFSISPEITFKSILTGGEISYVPGAQGVRTRGVSKFIFHKEGIGFGYCLMRAFLHKNKIVYWF
ncbi:MULTISPECIES: glycosyltransferase family 2 protein [unclassified Brucella]|uniref:glycosyltransferase family 2 protein n=1 Tax=unclassified Brucella TaxID=2632610 RepID=UPI0012AE246A|nr:MULTISPECIES: glycosyltransferase family 2 protein [unclassified Brucella]MRN44866.1 glycosyltransferase [Brucella sp. 09RB8913]MRN60343.1 glycosyltransferase [Brucella sp. 09RB8918]CAB4326857.1 Bifunctional apolipoprotein N-acyltransferase/polyprenol monophosphomannose synthase [Brucella sp. 191011898]